MLGPILAFVAGATTLTLLLAWAARTPAAGELARWAARYDLQLRREDRGWVAGELRRGRLLRTAGFTAMFATGMAATIWWTATHEVSGVPLAFAVLIDPAAWATAYLAGATLAELTRRRPGAQRVRAAALVPRRLGDYLPAWMLLTYRGVALVVLALTPLAARPVPGLPPPPGGASASPAAQAVVSGIAAVGIAALVELALRAMVRRGQPVATPDELAVDDALRSTAIRRTAGAGLAALLFLLGHQLASLSGRWWLLGGLTYFLCYGLAIGVWKDLTVPLRWRIRRAYRSGGSGGPALPQRDPRRKPA
jgi:hypothetical protein